MIKTLRITLQLRITYKCNAVIYALRQLPLIGKHIPEALFGSAALKLLVTVIAIGWELVAAFLGKAVYFLLILAATGLLASTASLPVGEEGALFLHLYLLMTLFGARMNSCFLGAEYADYYAICLLGMDARRYILVSYGYELVKLLVGHLIFSVGFGLMVGAPLWLCLLMPFAVAGIKTAFNAVRISFYEKTGDKKAAVAELAYYVLVLAAAVVPPLLGWVLPVPACRIAAVTFLAAGLLCTRKLMIFRDYRVLFQQNYLDIQQTLKENESALADQSGNAISLDAGIVSSRRGFEYLNELFIKRHRKILWKPALFATGISLAVVALALVTIHVTPGDAEFINENIMSVLPIIPFVLYAMNRGTSFTQALFMNCDRSLLTYPFFKQRKAVLKLFAIRLREIVKVNLLPALVIALGLPLILYISGGTDDLMDYVVLFVSVVSISIFFSAHYLVLYYLLQPYTAGTELKNPVYQVITGLTYYACFLLMELTPPAFLFGLCSIVFCIAYCLIACVLVYLLAPRTFRIRA